MRKLATILVLVVAATAQAQWLPADKQAYNRHLWERTGVPFPEGAKFYDFTPAYQHAATMNGGIPFYKLIHSDYGISGDTVNLTKVRLWRDSGGLHNSPKDQWRSAKAMLLPRPMKVWKAEVSFPTGIRPVPVWEWSYPDGTVVADMLVLKRGGQEYAFEIRVREKADGKWDEGTAYRPFRRAEDVPGGRRVVITAGYDARERLDLLGVKRLESEAVEVGDLDPAILRDRKFVTPGVIVTTASNQSIVPRHYFGNAVRCATCHRLAGSVEAYASIFPGKDTVTSAHPFSQDSISPDGIARRVRFNIAMVGADSGLPLGEDRPAARSGSTAIENTVTYPTYQSVPSRRR